MKAEEERKAANKNHQRRINREVLEDLVINAIDEATAKCLIEMIAKNQISHLTINY